MDGIYIFLFAVVVFLLVFVKLQFLYYICKKEGNYAYYMYKNEWRLY